MNVTHTSGHKRNWINIWIEYLIIMTLFDSSDSRKFLSINEMC